VVLLIVVTDVKGIDGQAPIPKPHVHRLYGLAGLGAARHIRLVGDHDKSELRGPETAQGALNAGQDLHLAQGGWRVRLTVAHRGAVDDAVAIQEDGPLR
jgi:hypothetical protein